MNGQVLIVGGGQAAAEVASDLRAKGWHGSITIVTEEPHSPYQRPPLSKAFIAGKADETTLALRSDEFYERNNIQVVKQQKVESIKLPSPGEQGKGSAVCSSGERYEFDWLVLAVGAQPRQLRIPGSDLDGVIYLRDITDAKKMKAYLEVADSVLVIGGGFIGLEAAAVARLRGKDVTVLEASQRLIGRVVAPCVSEFYLAAHQRRGTKVEFGVAAQAFIGHEGKVKTAILQDGRQISAELVVIGIGVEPRVELAEQIGIRCDFGIPVDAHCRTSHPMVLAIGDCTVAPHPAASGQPIRLESVQNAVEQAKTAASTIVGQLASATTVPWFWSDQDTIKLQIAGLSRDYDQVIIKGDPDSEKFAVYYFRDGHMIAVDAINSPKDYMAAKRALSAKLQLTPSDLGL